MVKQAVISVKTYVERYPNQGKPFPRLPNGNIRKTGYVLFDFGCINHGKDVSRKWFPTKQQAKIERDTPGNYGERGIKF